MSMVTLFSGSNDKDTMPLRNKCAPGVKKGADGSCLPPGVTASTGCKTDICAAKKLGGKMLDRVRPEKPEKWLSNPRTWLDTNNINAVMRQYERAYPRFKYIATLPIDAYEAKRDGACVSEHKSLDFIRLARAGKQIIGMIFNLDKHDQSGSHWVMAAANFKDINAPHLYYYDSFGKAPPKEVKQLFRNIIEKLPKEIAKEAIKHVVYNKKQHQRGNSECGLMALMALEAVLRGADFKKYCKLDLNDEIAFKQRDRLFS